MQRVVTAMKRERNKLGSESVENALLRERITMARGKSRPDFGAQGRIDHEPSWRRPSMRPQNGPEHAVAQAANTNSDEGKGSLADRIRALQARSSRLSSAT